MTHVTTALALAAALATADAAPVAPSAAPAAPEAGGPAQGAKEPAAKESGASEPAPPAASTPATAAPAPSAAPATPAPPAAHKEKETVAEREPVGALIRRTVAAYGGSRARVRLARVRVTGTVGSSIHPGEVGRYSRTFARGRGLRIEVGFTKSDPEVRVLNGARAWRYGEPAPQPVTAALQLEAARLDLPDLLIDREAQLQDQGEVKHEGQTLRVLGLEVAAGSRLECGIEPKTGRILYVRGVVRSGPRELELFTVFRSFKVVDGVLVAFREEGYANGESTGDVDIGAVEFLDDVPDATFAP